MATVTKTWCDFANDNGSITYSFDSTVSSGFPHGKMTSIAWANAAAQPETVRITLEPGQTGADLQAGVVNSIPLAAASPVPMASGETVVVGGVSFTTSAVVVVGATSIPVTSQSIGALIPAGSSVESPLPEVTIPASGQEGHLPAFFGGTAISSTDSVNLTNLGIPMQTITGLGGHTLTVPPADLGCAG